MGLILLGFAAEAMEQVVACVVRADDFQRDDAMRACLLGLVDDAHAAAGDAAEDAEALRTP